MKYRPISLRTVPVWPHRSIPSLQCRSNFHLDSLHNQRPAVTLSPKYHQWHDRSRNLMYSSRYQYLRHASSFTAAVVKRVPSPSASPRTKKSSEKLNPPKETYAPELSVPERKKGQTQLAWLYHAGRAYIAFYKSGIANVRSTFALAKRLRAKATQGKQKGEEVLTRAEWQVVRRSRLDMLRLPAFGALVLLMGEWLPLLAFYITPVFPEPCRIPAQIRRSLKKLEQRRKERERRLALDAARLVAADGRPGKSQSLNAVPSPSSVRLEDIEHLDSLSLLTLSTKLDAHSKIWDFMFVTPPKTILQWGVGRKLAYLEKDDGLIERDGGWQSLGKEEGMRACVDRGINVLERSDTDMRKDLAAWFGKRQSRR